MTINFVAANSFPDLSVVIPCYNQPEQLALTLEDLNSQTDLTLEVFVVDDASEKSCVDVVDGFQKKGLNITLLQQQQRSYTLAARLRGMREAQGRWLAFIDADDRLCSPSCLAQAVQEADSKNVDVLHFVTLVDDGGGRLCARCQAAPFSTEPLYGRSIFSTWLDKDCPAHSVWNKLYSRHLYQKLLEISHDIHIFRIEDFYLTSHFLFLARSYAPSTVPVYKYTPPIGTHLEKTAARALDAMRMYLTLPSRFLAAGLSLEESNKYKMYLRALLTLNAGRMCRFLERTDSPHTFLQEIHPDSIKRIRQYGNAKDFFITLVIANASNAQKLRGLYSILTKIPTS